MSLWDDIVHGVESAVGIDPEKAESAVNSTADWLSSGGPAELTKEIKQLKTTIVIGVSVLALIMLFK